MLAQVSVHVITSSFTLRRQTTCEQITESAPPRDYLVQPCRPRPCTSRQSWRLRLPQLLLLLPPLWAWCRLATRSPWRRCRVLTWQVFPCHQPTSRPALFRSWSRRRIAARCRTHRSTRQTLTMPVSVEYLSSACAHVFCVCLLCVYMHMYEPGAGCLSVSAS